MDFKFVDFENRPGYYKDEYGRWQEDRREEPDRRWGAVVTVAQSASRKNARRQSDRDALSFLDIDL